MSSRRARRSKRRTARCPTTRWSTISSPRCRRAEFAERIMRDNAAAALRLLALDSAAALPKIAAGGTPMRRCSVIAAARSARVRYRSPRTRRARFRASPSNSSCRSRPAASTTCWRASSPTSCRPSGASRSSSSRRPAPAATSAPTSRRRPSPTATRCWFARRAARDQPEPLQEAVLQARRFRADHGARRGAERGDREARSCRSIRSRS